MAINPLTSAQNYVSQIQPQPQSYADRKIEQQAHENVQQNNREVTPSNTVTKANGPTVNLSGQTIGSTISVKA